MRSFRFAHRRLVFADAALSSAVTLHAMSVIAPTFAELVQDATTGNALLEIYEVP